MGCGGSKLNSEQEAGLRPILRRRIDEFLAQRNASLSKKKLLAGDVTAARCSDVEEEEVKTPRSPLNASNEDHAFLPTQVNPPSPQKNISNNIDNDNDSSSLILSPKLEDKYDVNNIKIDVNNVDNFVDIKCVDVKCENDLYENKEVIKEEECIANRYDEYERSELLCPSSPSFRVYCVNSLDEEEIDGHLEPLEECSHDDDKNWLRQESSNSNKVVEEKNTILKKHKRGKMFKIGIPKGGKHIFHNIPSLYHFTCSSHNAQFVQQAVA